MKTPKNTVAAALLISILFAGSLGAAGLGRKASEPPPAATSHERPAKTPPANHTDSAAAGPIGSIVGHTVRTCRKNAPDSFSLSIKNPLTSESEVFTSPFAHDKGVVVKGRDGRFAEVLWTSGESYRGRATTPEGTVGFESRVVDSDGCSAKPADRGFQPSGAERGA